jgi:serine/threonine protein kinase
MAQFPSVGDNFLSERLGVNAIATFATSHGMIWRENVGGIRLGPYQILAPIGAGGIGEVYRGQDTRLNRAVAVKLLPLAVCERPGSRAVQFQRIRDNVCLIVDYRRGLAGSISWTS